MGLENEIRELEEEIANTPYNKSTEEHIGRLKSKLADKKEEQEKRQQSSSGGGGYAVEQTGDATVALVGFPSVGKSTLLNKLTNAESETGSYEFTTLDVNPGMMKYRGANIQILDVPGLIEGAANGRGGGKAVLSVVRSADLIVFVLSPFEIEQYSLLYDELYDNKIRVDTEPPRVSVREKGKGGLRVSASVDLDMDDETVKSVLREQSYVNADVTVHEDLGIDRLIDGVMDNRSYVPSLVTVNKVDLVEGSYTDKIQGDLNQRGLSTDEVVFISAEGEMRLDVLKERIWDDLSLKRVYLDKPSRGVDYDEPLILRRDSTVSDACEKIGGELDEKFRFARVSGDSVEYEKKQVGGEHVLSDEDVMRIVTA